MLHLANLLFLCGCALFLPQALAQNCYLPNGTDINALHAQFNKTQGYTSCNVQRPGGSHSMCCILGGALDKCTSNGLCEYNLSHYGTYYRRACTDPTWQDPGCLQLYVDGFDSRYNISLVDTDAEVWQCPDGSFCLDTNNHTCCDGQYGYSIDKNGVVLPDSADPVGTAASTSATTVSAATSISQAATASASLNGISSPSTSETATGVPATASQSPTSTPVNGSHANELGAIVGGAVGGVVGLGLVVALILALVFRHRRNHKTSTSKLVGQSGHDHAELYSIERPHTSRSVHSASWRAVSRTGARSAVTSAPKELEQPGPVQMSNESEIYEAYGRMYTPELASPTNNTSNGAVGPRNSTFTYSTILNSPRSPK